LYSLPQLIGFVLNMVASLKWRFTFVGRSFVGSQTAVHRAPYGRLYDE
jgi:hypothetical protein